MNDGTLEWEEGFSEGYRSRNTEIERQHELLYMQQEAIKKKNAEIERLRAAVETISVVEAGSAAAAAMRLIAVRALVLVREALGDG